MVLWILGLKDVPAWQMPAVDAIMLHALYDRSTSWSDQGWCTTWVLRGQTEISKWRHSSTPAVVFSNQQQWKSVTNQQVWTLMCLLHVMLHMDA